MQEQEEEEEGEGGCRSRYDTYRSQLSPEELINIEISRFTSLPYRIWPSSPESKRFLELINTLNLKINHLESISIEDRRRRQSLDKLENVVMKKAMTRLEEEFSYLLIDQATIPTVEEASTGSPSLATAIPVAQPIEDYNIVITPFSNANISSLREIAWAMASAGYGKMCANAYSIARREFVTESMSRLGMITESNKIYDIRTAKFVFLVLFPSEKKLTERVFFNLPALSDLAFADTCREPAVEILRYAAMVATQENSTERLFTVVGTYEVLREITPQIETLFSDDNYCSYLVEEFRLCLNNLAATVRDVFVLLENSIYRDPASGSLPETGSVHPLTSYVINYLDLASKFWQTLEEIMSDGPISPSINRLPSSCSSLSIQIGWIMGRLNRNLETKSKSYTNEALGFIFLINNGRYIVDRLGQSILARVIGQDWIRGQLEKIREWNSLYLTKTWTKIMAVLQVSVDNGRFAGSLGTMKQKIKYFNTYLEEICEEQGGWVLVSEQLKKEVTESIVEVVVVEYRNFLELGRREWKKEMFKLVKYDPNYVEDVMIRGLFKVVPRTRGLGSSSNQTNCN